MKIPEIFFYYLVIFLSIKGFDVVAQDDVKFKTTSDTTSDVNKIRFVYQDIYNFIEAYTSLKNAPDSASVLKEKYIDRASPGLKMFIEKYGLNVNGLLNAIRKNPGRYDSVRFVPALIDKEQKAFIIALKKFREYLPDIIFPPFYFLVGSTSGSINSASKDGLLFEIQSWKPGREAHHTALMVHELTHFQQVLAVGLKQYLSIFEDPNKLLINYVFREGIAEFFADLVTGRYTQEQSRQFAVDNEEMLWQKLNADMNNRETGDWMWRTPQDPKQPKDVGYVYGAMIVRAWYEQAPDKLKALKEMLSVTDYKEFLFRSNYKVNKKSY